MGPFECDRRGQIANPGHQIQIAKRDFHQLSQLTPDQLSNAMTGIGNSLSEPNSYSSNHDGELEGLRGQNLQGLIAWVEHNIGRILRDDARTNRRSSPMVARRFSASGGNGPVYAYLRRSPAWLFRPWVAIEVDV